MPPPSARSISNTIKGHFNSGNFQELWNFTRNGSHELKRNITNKIKLLKFCQFILQLQGFHLKILELINKDVLTGFLNDIIKNKGNANDLLGKINLELKKLKNSTDYKKLLADIKTDVESNGLLWCDPPFSSYDNSIGSSPSQRMRMIPNFGGSLNSINSNNSGNDNSRIIDRVEAIQIINNKLPNLTSSKVNDLLGMYYEDGCKFIIFNRAIENVKKLEGLLVVPAGSNNDKDDNNDDKIGKKDTRKYLTSLDSKTILETTGNSGNHFSKVHTGNLINNLSNAKHGNFFITQQSYLTSKYVNKTSPRLTYYSWLCYIILIAPYIPTSIEELEKDKDLVEIFKNPLLKLNHLEGVFEGVNNDFLNNHNIKYDGNVK